MLLSLVNLTETFLFLATHLFLTSLVLPVLFWCQSKKKFLTDGRAELVPRNPAPADGPPTMKDESQSSFQKAPTDQRPPANTPIERSSDFDREQDTLANVQSLPPDKSEAPLSDKKDKKKNKKKK